MDYFKTMNEKDLDLTKTAVDWTDLRAICIGSRAVIPS